MPNFSISDLPPVVLPLDLPNTLFEVQTVEGGIQVSRKVAASDLNLSGGITVEDEGIPLPTLATTLNFVGASVVASGTGATKTITISGVAAGVASVNSGTNVTVDNTDPANPIVNLNAAILGTSVNGVTLSNAGVATNYLDETGNYSVPAAGGQVDSVSGGTNINISGTAVDPIVNLDAAITGTSVNGVTLTTAGAATNFLNEAGTYSVPAGTGVQSVSSGTNISVDNTDPINPIINLPASITSVSVNGVTLTTAGAATNYLDETGSYSVPAGTGVQSVSSGTNISVDNTDPINPIINLPAAITGTSVNGVTLTTAGSATNFLNEQGNYVAAGGGTLDVEDEGTSLGGGPYTILNFTGTGITATDAGGGQADITVGGSTAEPIISKYKTSGTAKSNDDTLADDPHLAGFVLEPNTTYTIEGWFQVEASSVTPDLQFEFQTDVAFAFGFKTIMHGQSNTGQETPQPTTLTTNSVIDITSTDERFFWIKGVVRTGGSQTTVDFQWAQDTANASPVVLTQGCWLEFTQVDPGPFGGVVAAGITVQDEGTPLTTLASTLNFTGAGVTASGSGTTKTINIPGGGGSPGGADSNVQYNNGGAFGGEAAFTWNDVSKFLQVGTTSLNPLILNQDVNSNGSATNIQIQMEDSVNADRTYAQIGGVIVDNTAASIDGAIDLSPARNNSLTAALRVDGQTGLRIQEVSVAPTTDLTGFGWLYIDTDADLKFRDEGGTVTNLLTGGGGTPAGADTQVQYNNAGSFGADPSLTWDNATETLTIGDGSTGTAFLTINAGTQARIRFDDNDAALNDKVGEIRWFDGSMLFVQLTDALGTKGVPFRIDEVSALQIGEATTNPTADTAGRGWLYIDSADNNIKYRDEGGNIFALNTGAVAGSDSQVQYNNGGVFGGDPNFTWNDTTNKLTIGDTNTIPLRLFNNSQAVNSRVAVEFALDDDNSLAIPYGEVAGVIVNNTGFAADGKVEIRAARNSALQTMLTVDAVSGFLLQESETAPTVDATGFGWLYIDPADADLKFRDEGGTVTNLLTGGGGGITVEDEGTPLATTATTLDFVGAGVTASGTGATKTITVPGASSLQGGVGMTLLDTVDCSSGTSAESVDLPSGPVAYRLVISGLSGDAAAGMILECRSGTYSGTGVSGGVTRIGVTNGAALSGDDNTFALGTPAADRVVGIVDLIKVNATTWVATGSVTADGGAGTSYTNTMGSEIILTGDLDKMRFKPFTGNFDGSGEVLIYAMGTDGGSLTPAYARMARRATDTAAVNQLYNLNPTGTADWDTVGASIQFTSSDGNADGITIGTNQMTIDRAGRYAITFTASGRPQANNARFFTQIVDNSTTVLAASQSTQVATSNTVTEGHVTLIDDFDAGDILTFHLGVNTSNVNVFSTQVDIVQLDASGVPVTPTYTAVARLANSSAIGDSLFNLNPTDSQDWDGVLGALLQFTSANETVTSQNCTVGTNQITVNEDGVYRVLLQVGARPGVTDAILPQITDGTNVLAASLGSRAPVADTPSMGVAEYVAQITAGTDLDFRILQSAGDLEVMQFSISLERIDVQSGTANLTFDGNLKGTVNTATPPTTENVDTIYNLLDGDGTDLLASLGYETDDILVLRKTMHNNTGIEFRAEDSAGTDHLMLRLRPDTNQSELYYDDDAVLRTNTAASGGAQSKNSKTATGFERVLTETDTRLGKTVYTFDTSTIMADPGAGDYRFDNGTAASVTQIAVSATTENTGGNDIDIGEVWRALTAGAQVQIQNLDDSDENYVFTIDSITDNTTWFLLDVTFGDSGASGVPSAGEDSGFILTNASGAGGGAGSNVTVIRKTAAESVNNSNVTQQDNELNGINLVTGAEYVIEAELIFTPVTSTMGIKADFILASGSWDQRSWTATCFPDGMSAGARSYANGAYNSAIAIIVPPAETLALETHVMRIKAYVTVSSAAVLELQWAQQTAIASNLNLLAGSYMQVTRIS